MPFVSLLLKPIYKDTSFLPGASIITGIFFWTLSCSTAKGYPAGQLFILQIIHNVAILVQFPFFFPSKQINYFTFTVLS